MRFVFCVSALLVTSLIGGCATPARDLPPDRSSVNATNSLTLDSLDPKLQALNCEDITLALEALNQDISELEDKVRGRRNHNQKIGLIAAIFFSPVWIAADSQENTKTRIEEVNRSKDVLIALSAHRQCDS